jgi:cell shape-determining protein MreD
MKFLVFLLLVIALILESTLTTIPFVFLCLLVFMVLTRASWMFIFAFIFGLLLDCVGFKTLGLSSGFFLIVLFLVLLYQSKFEIQTNPFILVASLLGSLGYLILMGYGQNLLPETILSSVLGLALFKIIKNSERLTVNNS